MQHKHFQFRISTPSLKFFPFALVQYFISELFIDSTSQQRTADGLHLRDQGNSMLPPWEKDRGTDDEGLYGRQTHASNWTPVGLFLGMEISFALLSLRDANQLQEKHGDITN